jgi:hypothetical protein
MKGKVNNSCASGDGAALVSSWKSMLLPGYNNLLATNFIVSGFGGHLRINAYNRVTCLYHKVIFKNFDTKLTSMVQQTEYLPFFNGWYDQIISYFENADLVWQIINITI